MRRTELAIAKNRTSNTVTEVGASDLILSQEKLGVEIVDEADQEAIEEGTGAEDLREFAKEKFGKHHAIRAGYQHFDCVRGHCGNFEDGGEGGIRTRVTRYR